jgi:hypothetical protein
MSTNRSYMTQNGIPLVYQSHMVYHLYTKVLHGIPKSHMVYQSLTWYTNGIPMVYQSIPMVYQCVIWYTNGIPNMRQYTGSGAVTVQHSRRNTKKRYTTRFPALVIRLTYYIRRPQLKVLSSGCYGSPFVPRRHARLRGWCVASQLILLACDLPNAY